MILPHSARRARSMRTARLGALVVAVAALLSTAAASAQASTAAAPRAAADECTTVVAGLQSSVSSVTGGTANGSAKVLEQRRRQVQQLFERASEEHPSCAADVERFGAQLAAAARANATVKGTPFWGPVGWLWNNVYYRVFNGNDVMMALFGWALLLSPLILVFALWWTLRGAKGAFRRPFVPEHLRTDA